MQHRGILRDALAVAYADFAIGCLGLDVAVGVGKLTAKAALDGVFGNLILRLAPDARGQRLSALSVDGVATSDLQHIQCCWCGQLERSRAP